MRSHYNAQWNHSFLFTDTYTPLGTSLKILLWQKLDPQPFTTSHILFFTILGDLKPPKCCHLLHVTPYT